MTSEPLGRELIEEFAGALRDRPPDVLTPIDEGAPVSGHFTPPARATHPTDAPEHDWTAARDRLFPLLRPVGTGGVPVDSLHDPTTLSRAPSHVHPVVAEAPCGLVVAFTIEAHGFDVLVNEEHLLSWGIGSAALQDAALRNLGAWSERVGWINESSGDRHLVSSDSGQGHDAARILLPQVRRFLRRELTGNGAPPGTRILVGLPERHLLVVGALVPSDGEFVGLFREFVIEQAAAAEEPIDRRTFELVGDELVEFEG
ncbi:MAG: hypothetical protein M3301_09695 [Chloroflexota bacterium]|nr:hypothetical protein [Chloroflexota bacterium]